NRTGTWAIYQIDANGSALRQLTTGTGGSFFPAWSPDGQTIAFTSSRDGHDEIYLMRADGTNPIPLPPRDADNWQPAWSPDGTRIAFYSTRDKNADVYVMAADGSGQTNLSRTPGTDEGSRIAWSPDGGTIFYATRAANTPPTWLTTDLGIA